MQFVLLPTERLDLLAMQETQRVTTYHSAMNPLLIPIGHSGLVIRRTRVSVETMASLAR